MNINVDVSDLRRQSLEVTFGHIKAKAKAREAFAAEVISNIPSICHAAAKQGQTSVVVMHLDWARDVQSSFTPLYTKLKGPGLDVFNACKAANLKPKIEFRRYLMGHDAECVEAVIVVRW